MAKKKKVDYEAELIWEYEHWEYLKEYGGSDPHYDDGVNMNLTRNHIIYIKHNHHQMNYTKFNKKFNIICNCACWMNKCD